MSAKTANKIATGVIVSVAGLIVLVLAGLLGFILVRGLGHISFDFLTSAPKRSAEAAASVRSCSTRCSCSF